VTAAFAIASAISTPAQGRLIDRIGHTRTLPLFSVVGALLTVGLVVAVQQGAPLGFLIVIAALAAAANPPMFPALRPLWADLIDRPEQLGTAYAIHAVMAEINFIVGPILAAVLVAGWSAAAAVLAITALKTVGTLAFAATPASRRWRGERHDAERHWLGPLASPGMRAMLIADVPFGALIGLLDVAVPAFAKEEGSTALAGVLLAALAVGSMIGGVVYGSRPRTLSGKRYAHIAALQALLTVPLIFASTPLALGVGMALAGLAVAPLTVVGSGITDVVAPAGTATEATSWVVTAYSLGLAVGTASAGAIVDGPGTQTAFVAAAGCAVFSAAVLWIRRGLLDGHGLKTVGNVAPTPAVTAIDQ
jgi:MFS family permease